MVEEEELTVIEDDDTPFEEEETEERGSISLGWIFHALMSAKARLFWLLGAAYRSLVASSSPARAIPFQRQEPNLTGRTAPSIAPQAGADEDEDEDDEEEEEEEPAPRRKAASRGAPRQTRDKVGIPPGSNPGLPEGAAPPPARAQRERKFQFPPGCEPGSPKGARRPAAEKGQTREQFARGGAGR